jgi:hypothetical protein
MFYFEFCGFFVTRIIKNSSSFKDRSTIPTIIIIIYFCELVTGIALFYGVRVPIRNSHGCGSTQSLPPKRLVEN